MSENPYYVPGSAGGGQQAARHVPMAQFRGVNGTVLHPWQSSGLVSSASHDAIPVQAAADLSPGLSGQLVAARVVLPLPPIYQPVGDPLTDATFML